MPRLPGEPVALRQPREPFFVVTPVSVAAALVGRRVCPALPDEFLEYEEPFHRVYVSALSLVRDRLRFSPEGPLRLRGRIVVPWVVAGQIHDEALL